MKNLDEIISLFTNKRENIRAELREPILDKGNVVATDAISLIIVPAKYCSKKYDTLEVREKFPTYEKAIPEHNSSEVEFTISPVELYRICNELPKEDIYTKCDNCDGEGILFTHKRNKRECKCCNGTGDDEYLGLLTRIPFTDDTNRNVSYILSINGIYFNPNIIIKIAKLGQVMGGDIKCIKAAITHANRLFYVNDILVLIAPLRLSKEDIKEYYGKMNTIEVPVIF